jgi:hypothetical protein
MLCFLKFVATILQEINDFKEVYFKIRLNLTSESKKEEGMKNGEHYKKRKCVIYTSSSSLLWY